MRPLKLILCSALLMFVCFTIRSQSPIDTTWTGTLDVMNTKIGIVVKFKTENNSLKGTIDIPEQKATGLELSEIKFNNPSIHFELDGQQKAIFDGVYYVDSISGTFMQAGVNATFSLLKGESAKIPTVIVPPPTELTYNAEEVSFSNDGNIFSGTLTTPKTSGTHPAVVLITGSGAQTRDEELLGFKIFGIIADHLTKNGIAVLRYDDRGTGMSVGKSVNESTTEDFAGDVTAAVEYLKTRSDINPTMIGLMGHSEGGIVAPIAANRSGSVAFVVLMAGTGVMGIDIIKEQSKLIMKADNSSDKEIQGYLRMLDSVYIAVRDNKPLDEIKERIKNDIIENFNDLPKEQRKNIKNKEQYANDVAEMTISEFKSKWMQYFLRYDPYDALMKLKCPALVLFGELDLQVPPSQNEKPMVNALKNGGNPDYKVVIFPKANHLFQEAVTGSPNEYGTLKKEFVPGFLDVVTSWILERVTVVK